MVYIIEGFSILGGGGSLNSWLVEHQKTLVTVALKNPKNIVHKLIAFCNYHLLGITGVRAFSSIVFSPFPSRRPDDRFQAFLFPHRALKTYWLYEPSTVTGTQQRGLFTWKGYAWKTCGASIMTSREKCKAHTHTHTPWISKLDELADFWNKNVCWIVEINVMVRCCWWWWLWW